MDANKHGIEAGQVLKENEPQINVDERRYFSASEFSKIIHRKERKAAQHEPPCPLCSLWLNHFSAPAYGRAPPQPEGWEVAKCVF